MKTASRLRSLGWLAAIALLAASLLCASPLSADPGGKGTLVHIGLVWLKNPGNSTERQQLIHALHRFAREIPEVRALTVGQPRASKSAMVDSTFDVCFTMHFEDQAALDRYAQNPVHEKAAREAFLPLAQKIQFYDFISE